MEIEPEVLPPEHPREQMSHERVRVTYYRPGPIATVLLGIVALGVGALMLFFMFWLGLLFTALGLIAFAVQWVRRKLQ